MFLELVGDVIRNAAGILSVYDLVQEGHVILSTGEHAIEIYTKKDPAEVHLTWVDQGSMAVCQGSLDYFSYTMIPGGFILYANIASEYAHIGYTVRF